MSGWSPLVEQALASLAELRVVRCGIHGDRIVALRCPSCDAERLRLALAVPSVTPRTYSQTNADQATQPKEQ